MNKEQLEFFYSEIMGLFGWGDEEEETGVDPLLWAREQLAQIRKDVVTWKNAERLALETVAQLRAERETEKRAYIQYQSYEVALRAENDELKAYYNRIMDEPCGDEIHCTCVPILKRELDKKENELNDYKTMEVVPMTSYEEVCSELDKKQAELDKKDAALEGVSNWATAWLSAHSQEEK